MTPTEEPGDFKPTILIVGDRAQARAPLLHGFLQEHVTRYGLLTAGVDPADTVAAGVMQIFEQEGISPEGIETGPLGRSVNQNLRLIVFVSEAVKQKAPVIAAPCENLVFDLPDPEVEINEGADPRDVFYRLRDRIKKDAVPAILDEIQSGHEASS